MAQTPASLGPVVCRTKAGKARWGSCIEYARLTAGMGTLLAWGLLNTNAGTIGRATATTDRGRGF